MDRVEQAVVRQCLRQLLGDSQARLGSHEAIAARLQSEGQGIEKTDANSYLYTRSVRKRIWEAISEAALDILLTEATKVIAFYDKENRDISLFLARIFQKYRNDRTPPKLAHRLQGSTSLEERSEAIDAEIVDIIFRNWKQPPRASHSSLRTGLYQIFRRYKPSRDQKTQHTQTWHDWSKDENHAVVCELWYIDLEKLGCKLVTGDMNIYHGSLNITHEYVLYSILQRPARNKVDIHQRFIASRIEMPDFEMYSGICMKIGNLSTRPIAADFFYLHIPQDSNADLYREFDKILDRSWNDAASIGRDSVIADYIAITPPTKPRSNPDWSRVRYVKDFPALLKLALRTDNYIALFREPLRTLGAVTLGEVLSDIPLEIFRQSLQRAAEESKPA